VPHPGAFPAPWRYGLLMISRLELSKHSLQQYADAAAASAGAMTGIVVGAVRDLTEELGSLATELLQITDAASRANDSDD